MVPLLKKFICIAVLVATAPLASAFSLLGEPEAWQTPALGYDPTGTDIGAPKNLGEEYRWNVPIITYGYDLPFLNYFGSPGVQAVERAIAILNSLPPVSTLSQDLREFPLLDENGEPTQFMEARRVNPEAQAMQLVDLKTVALSLLVEELGLAAPERWVWALRDRKTFGGPPPETNYLVIMRNFDPVTYEPSYFVNGIRYTYTVREFENPTFADAVENIPVDPRFPPFNSVAGISGGLLNTGLDAGVFYTYLTRDDIGGLRYIYHPNNINFEPFPPGTQIFTPDRTNFLSLTNQDLTLLSLLSLTATPQQLSNVFPGIIVTNAVRRGSATQVDVEITTNTITVGLLTNRSQLLLITNTDLAALSSLTRTSEPAALLALGLNIASTNLLGLTTEVQIASIALTNVGAPLFTNRNNLTVITNQDLYVLSRLSLTSPPPVLLTAFPGLFITSTNTTVRTVVEPSLIYVTNAPPEPWGVPGVTNFIFVTNYVTNLQTLYFYTYGNVITNYVSPITRVQRVVTGLEKEPWSVPSNPVYKTTREDVFTTEISGGFTIVPPNVAGYEFTGFTTTNLTLQTNLLISTNFIDPNTGLLRTVSRAEFTTFTNLQYAVYPIEIIGPGQQVLMTNYVTNIVRLFDYRFRNVITNFSFFPSQVTLQDLTIQQDLFRPGFPPTTNAVSRTFLSNFVSGGAVIVPTNLFGFEFTGLAITNVIPITNVLVNAVNPITGTTFQQVAIYNFTNVVYGVYPIEFLPQGFVTNILTTNFVVREVDLFNFEFANVITNPPPFTFPSRSPFSPTTVVTNFVFQVVADPASPTGLRTNLIGSQFGVTIPVPSGGFVIDTNLTGYEFSGLATTNIISVTNQIASITDPTIFTNVVYRFTNVVYGVFPFVLQPAPAVARRPGVDKLTFVRVGGTNLVSGGDLAYTNRFRASYITNGFLVTSTFVITNTQPDILFSAADLGVFNDSVVPIQSFRTENFVNNGALNTQNPNPNPTEQGGPGTILPQVVISFNKIGPSIVNFFPGGVTEPDITSSLFQRPFVWGSFDGSTNPPIVFPEDITLEDLELQIMNQQP